MAHDLNFNESLGRHAFFGAKTPAWHGLGKIVDKVLTWREAIVEAGLNYTVQKRPIFDASQRALPGFMGTFRADTDGFLGIVGDRYQIVQPKDAFTFVDILLGNVDGAHYETAGALGAGERMWCMARVPGGDIDVMSMGDKHLQYLLFTTSFDGSLANTAKLVQTRVVCANTVARALGEKGAEWRWKHTENVAGRLKAASSVVQTAIQSSKDLESALTLLARKQMTPEVTGGILDRLFPPTGQKQTRHDKIVMKVLELFESNDQNAFPAVRGTAYNMFNAITEYADHHRGVRVTEARKGVDQNIIRAENAMFGDGAKLKASALAVITDMVKGLPDKPTKTISVPTESFDSAFMKDLGVKLD